MPDFILRFILARWSGVPEPKRSPGCRRTKPFRPYKTTGKKKPRRCQEHCGDGKRCRVKDWTLFRARHCQLGIVRGPSGTQKNWSNAFCAGQISNKTRPGVSYTAERIMSLNTKLWWQLGGFPEDGRAWLKAAMHPVRLYGLAAFFFTCAFRVRFYPGPPFHLAHVLLVAYILCVGVLSWVGFKQWRSGTQRTAYLNFGFAVLNAFLGWFAWFVIQHETNKWL